MAESKQSGSASIFMPWLKDQIAKALDMPASDVRIATEDTERILPHRADRITIDLVLQNPTPVNPRAGGGRYCFPISRMVKTILVTRSGLDKAGEDQIALMKHWDLQDQLINYFLVNPSVETDQFAITNTYIGGSDDVKKVKDGAGVYKSALIFELNYIAKVDIV